MKGIILAGGKGTRLNPLTLAVSKQLLPVYNKPMIYYPLSTLMSIGIRDILVITTREDSELFKRLLKDGKQWGINITYKIQERPKGLAEAFILAEEFIDNDSSCLILGDNIFFGNDIDLKLRASVVNAWWREMNGAKIFAYEVDNPERYGVVSFTESGNVLDIEEKPVNPKSNFAVPGIYFYDKNVSKYAKELKPSLRGELEITDLNKVYMKKEALRVSKIERGTAWLDVGTHESILQASNFISAIESRQGFLVGSPDETAYRMGFIDKDSLWELIAGYGENSYSDGLKRVLKD